MRPAVFFDRDGVINALVDRGAAFEAKHGTRLTSPWHFTEFYLFEQVASVVAAVQHKGYLAIVATNQPAIANNEMQESELQKMTAAVMQLGFDDIRICPHNDKDGCSCRKPKPGLLVDAAYDWNIDLRQSFFVGDSDSDIAAAWAAGCFSVLLCRDYNANISAHFRVQRLSELPELIPQL